MPPKSVSAKSLLGRRVLVVEDEYFLADDIVQALKHLGASIAGPFGELEEAVAAVDGEIAIDAAVVDVNLRNEMVFSLARRLQARKIPFVFTTGYDRSSILPEFQDVSLWEKPLDIPAMTRELTSLIESE